MLLKKNCFLFLFLICTNIIASESIAPPNVFNVVKKMKQEYPGELQRSENGFTTNTSREQWEFVDRVIQKLHAMDPRFGYVQSGNRLQGDAVCYSVKQGSQFNRCHYLAGEIDKVENALKGQIAKHQKNCGQ